MKVSIIVAMDKNNGIGYQNRLPWHIPSELKYFKSLTLNKTIVMGRKTFESIGKPLVKRENIILTRNKNFFAPDCKIYHNMADILQDYKDNEELMIIGGLDIYKLFINIANKLYISTIEGGFLIDTYFPVIDFSQFILIKEEKHLGFTSCILSKL